MKNQHEIAETLIFYDIHLNQMAQLAFQQLSTLNLTYSNPSYYHNRKTLHDLVKKSLLHYVSPTYVLSQENFISNNLKN